MTKPSFLIELNSIQLKTAQGSTVAGAAHRPRNFLQNLQAITWPISPLESPNRDFLRN
jgi:hypothetical protein